VSFKPNPSRSSLVWAQRCPGAGQFGRRDAAPLPRPYFPCPQHLPFPMVSMWCAAEAGLCWAGG